MKWSPRENKQLAQRNYTLVTGLGLELTPSSLFPIKESVLRGNSRDHVFKGTSFLFVNSFIEISFTYHTIKGVFLSLLWKHW